MKLNIKLLVLFILSIPFINAANVTINLNMSTAGSVTDSTHNLVLRGSFNGWAGNDMALTSQGGDYYTYTGALDAESYEFKFAAVDLSTGTDTWESTDNRVLNVSANDTTISCYWQNTDQPPYTPTDSIAGSSVKCPDQNSESPS